MKEKAGVMYIYMYMYCFALFVCLTLLASFFLPSHLSVYTSSPFFSRKVTALGVCCVVLLCCLYDVACFFLP